MVPQLCLICSSLLMSDGVHFPGACCPMCIWFRYMAIQVLSPFFNWVVVFVLLWVLSVVELFILEG